ncbi:hypothetical protein AB0M72_13880 [Nocardiopsis dassonvillei]
MTMFQEGEAVLGSWVAALPIGSLDLSLLGGTSCSRTDAWYSSLS